MTTVAPATASLNDILALAEITPSAPTYSTEKYDVRRIELQRTEENKLEYQLKHVRTLELVRTGENRYPSRNRPIKDLNGVQLIEDLALRRFDSLLATRAQDRSFWIALGEYAREKSLDGRTIRRCSESLNIFLASRKGLLLGRMEAS